MQSSVTSSEQIQVHRLGLPVTVGAPLVALFLQAYVPIYLPFFTILDLPLLVTIFFAVARRGPVSGLLTGGVIGLVQDSLTHQPLGLYGIAKTIIGYLASSLGVKLDVENHGSRFLMTFVFYLLHETIYHAVARGLVREALQMRWGHMLIAAIINAIVAVPIFTLLDKAKRRA